MWTNTIGGSPLRASGQPVDGDHGAGTHGRGAQGVEQRGPAGDAAPALDPHQDVGLRARGRQPHPPATLQIAQRGQAAAPLQPPPGVNKTELVGQPIRQSRAVQSRIVPRNRLDPTERRGRAQPALDLVLNLHDAQDK